jgi:plasmid stabilization system protein ParE
MIYKIVNRSEVKSDILSAVSYYTKINRKLAKQLLFRIREAKTAILRTPYGFQVKYKDVRTYLLKQFPYHIHYLVDSSRNQIVILAFIHSYKNPQDYSQRKE